MLEKLSKHFIKSVDDVMAEEEMVNSEIENDLN